MEKLVTAMLIYFVSFLGCFCKSLEEPTCSKYDFEEKVLEKVVRFEHKMKVMTSSFNEISAMVKNEIQNMKTVMETRGTEQSNAFNKLSDNIQANLTRVTDNIQTEWTEIKKDFDMLKQTTLEQGLALNDTVQKEINILKQSFQDLSAKVQQPSYAFLAYDLSAARPSNGAILVFTKTDLNENGCYSTSNGQYTVPVDGVYEFHATLTSGYVNKLLYVEFRMGGTTGRFMLDDYNYFDSTSGSVIARLTKGTKVYIRVTSVSSGFIFREDNLAMNTFTGHMISH